MSLKGWAWSDAYFATEEQLAKNIWVVGRHEIDYRKPILPVQEVHDFTRVHHPEGMRFNRSVWLVSPDKKTFFVQVKTIWLLLNPETGRPKRIDKKLLKTFEKCMVD
jgi:acyl-CoA thioester hydrolase